jgi:O-antigen/teichoic acid export membrane protein
MATVAVTTPGRTRAALVALLTSYAGAAITIVKGFVLIPLYLHYFGIDVYGAWLASANIVSLLALFDVGLSGVMYQRLATAWGARDEAAFARTSCAAMILVPCIFAAISLTGVVLAPFVPPLVHAAPAACRALSVSFGLTSIGTAGSVVLGNVLAVSSAWQRTEISAASRIAGQLVEVATIVGGLVAGGGVIALGAGSAAGAACSCGIALVWTASRWRSMRLPRPRFDLAELRELTRTTLPMMLSRIVGQVASNIQVALVSAVISPTAAAVYGLTERVLTIGHNFIGPIAGSVLSGFAHLVGERGVRGAIEPTRELLAIWSLAVAAIFPTLLALNHDFTVLWIGGANYGGLVLNVALCSAAILGTREMVMSIVLMSAGGIRASAWISIVEAAVRIPIVYIALRAVGMYGMPTASGVVSVVGLLVWSRFVARELDVEPGRRTRLVLTGALAVGLTLAVGVAETVWLPPAQSWLSLVAKGSVLGALHLGLAAGVDARGWNALLRRLGRRGRAAVAGS